MILRPILAALTLCAVATVPARAELVHVGNFKPFQQGSYQAYPGMWSLLFDDTLSLGRKAIEGVDYVSSITVNKNTFPNHTTISWRVPAKPPELTGVYGYLQLAFGNYDGSIVPDRVPPAQISSIERLDVSLSYSYSGDDRFNLLNELYLLADPSDTSSVLFEVGVFARASREMMHYFEGGEQIGLYRDEHDRTWKAARRRSLQGSDFIMLIPDDGKDVAGQFNWAGIFGYLQQQGVLKGDEWFTGIAVGVEPVAGAGKLQVGTFAVNYQVNG